MNFTQPSDFIYVTGANIDALHPYGDLNRIEIDNDIMPVRNTEDKRKLRGMDIAFLMEAVEERARVVGLEDKSWTFSRNITLSQVNEIIRRYNAIADKPLSGLTGYWLDKSMRDDADYRELIMTDPSSGKWNKDLEKISEITDDDILFETVSNLYSKIGELTDFVHGNNNEDVRAFSFSGVDIIESNNDSISNNIRTWLASGRYGFCSFKYGSKYGHGFSTGGSFVWSNVYNEDFVGQISGYDKDDGFGYSFFPIGIDDDYSGSLRRRFNFKCKSTLNDGVITIDTDDVISAVHRAVEMCGVYSSGNTYKYCSYDLNSFMYGFQLRKRTRWDVEDGMA